MSLVNKERILNENPHKQLRIGFEKLKENYNESSALNYSELYKDKPLSFILENSRYIFSEPYYGYGFYKNIILGENEYGIFHEYGNELEKIRDYISENTENMPESQRVLYENLENSLSNKIDSMSNIILMANYTMEENGDDTKISLLTDVLYEYGNSTKEKQEAMDLVIEDVMDTLYDEKEFLVYAPFVNQITHNSSVIMNDIDRFFVTSESVESPIVFRDYIESVFTISKLSQDDIYNEAVSSVTNKKFHMIIDAYKQESAKDQIDALMTEKVKEIDTGYTTPKNAINHMFENQYETELFKEDNELFKEKQYGLQKIAYDILSDMVLFEYQNCRSTLDPIKGYNFFKEGLTIEEAYEDILKLTNEINNKLSPFMEAEEDLDNEISSISDGIDDEDEVVDSSKKVEAPKAKNLANKVQFKAMDAEAKQMKKMAEKKQKGQEVKNAVKAVTNLPKNVINNIKAQIKKIDEKDDDRRKKYMTEPGFRKKAFRNLKLALLYGGAASIKLALVPVTGLFRHFSKEKDRRVRNELINEIETNIKICDEKISDANAAGDNQEKYQLMRVKSELERERLRVRTNSKYI